MDPVQIIVQGGALGLLAVVLLVGGPRILATIERISTQFVAALEAANKTTRRAVRLVRTLATEVRQLADQVKQLGEEFREVKAAIAGRPGDEDADGK